MYKNKDIDRYLLIKVIKEVPGDLWYSKVKTAEDYKKVTPKEGNFLKIVQRKDRSINNQT